MTNTYRLVQMKEYARSRNLGSEQEFLADWTRSEGLCPRCNRPTYVRIRKGVPGSSFHQDTGQPGC